MTTAPIHPDEAFRLGYPFVDLVEAENRWREWEKLGENSPAETPQSAPPPATEP